MFGDLIILSPLSMFYVAKYSPNFPNAKWVHLGSVLFFM